MSYRSKTYIAFDGDNDIHYYRLMTAWRKADGTAFSFIDAHDINFSKDSSQEASIKRQLKERLDNSKLFILLVGDHTKFLYKFVKWEIEYALSNNLPIIVCNLNGLRKMDPDRCPTNLKETLAIHVPYKKEIMRLALSKWASSHAEHLAQGESGPYYYTEEVYKQLEL